MQHTLITIPIFITLLFWGQVSPAGDFHNFRPNLGNVMRGIPWQSMEREFKIENDWIEGKWSDSKSWSGDLCNGSYSYLTQVQGRVHDVEFVDIREDSLTANAVLRDLYFRADGKLRSSYTGCFTVKGWLGVGADEAKIKGSVYFDPNDTQKIEVRIVSTEFGKLDMGSMIPRWFEGMAQDMVNGALQHVWRSHLGTWLNGKINEIIQSKKPKPDGGEF